MNILPINKEHKRRQKWAERQRQCGKTLGIKHDTSARDAALRRAVMAELREFAK